MPDRRGRSTATGLRHHKRCRRPVDEGDTFPLSTGHGETIEPHTPPFYIVMYHLPSMRRTLPVSVCVDPLPKRVTVVTTA